jgi:hypothetical protein
MRGVRLPLSWKGWEAHRFGWSQLSSHAAPEATKLTAYHPIVVICENLPREDAVAVTGAWVRMRFSEFGRRSYLVSDMDHERVLQELSDEVLGGVTGCAVRMYQTAEPKP